MHYAIRSSVQKAAWIAPGFWESQFVNVCRGDLLIVTWLAPLPCTGRIGSSRRRVLNQSTMAQNRVTRGCPHSAGCETSITHTEIICLSCSESVSVIFSSSAAAFGGVQPESRVGRHLLVSPNQNTT